ncbi:hypothetical protein ACLFMI_09190 [Pseudonocardia nantongensis]|uniref:hypothetical protein n=1 Tax=Pseudonocardia nantongensis TaxID=1181885 RepID=UPI00397AD8AC
MSAPVVRIPSPRHPVGSAATAARGTHSAGIAVPAPRAPQNPADGAAHRLAVPAPRPASPRATAAGPAGPPGPGRNDTRPPAHPAAAGRHRAGARRSLDVPGAGVRGAAVSPSGRAFLAVARAGSLTTLAAMVVLAAAVAGLADGAVPTGPAAEVTTTLR